MSILKNLLQEINLLFVGYWDWLNVVFGNNKTKIYSLILFIVIILPGVTMPTIKTPIAELPNLPTFTSPFGNSSNNSLENAEKTQTQNQAQFVPPDLSFLTPKENIITPKLAPKLDIASIETKTETKKIIDNIIQKNKIAFEGKISWDETLSNPVATDKFGLGTNIKITYKEKITTKSVAQQRVLSDDNILMVNKATFVEIGGDPNTQKNLIANISEQ